MKETTATNKAAPSPFGVADNLAPLSPLLALSPLDGRYAGQSVELRHYFSEFALIRYRLKVEVEWLIFICTALKLPGAPEINPENAMMMREWVETFDVSDASDVKHIERTTRHDVKAIEYFLRNKLKSAGLSETIPFVHLCCTSEDINNLSHALMLKNGIGDVWLPKLEDVITTLASIARKGVDLPMLSRTHGQPASPTTLGKELAVFCARLKRQRTMMESQVYRGKFGGAVGNFNAHYAAYPDVDWPNAAKDFIESFGLEVNPTTTQIEPHDYMAEIFHTVIRTNSIILDIDRDMWTYISLGYFHQKLYAGEVGSSTMPHKVNPIDFENSEANCGISNALLDHLAQKLPVSRMQRDLSDSAAIRTMGVGFGHSFLAMKGCLAGLGKVEINASQITADLDSNWAVLGEAVQTILRKHGREDAYETIKQATQNQELNAESLRSVLVAAKIPEPDLSRLLAMTPENFVGLAAEIATRELDEL